MRIQTRRPLWRQNVWNPVFAKLRRNASRISRPEPDAGILGFGPRAKPRMSLGSCSPFSSPTQDESQ